MGYLTSTETFNKSSLLVCNERSCFVFTSIRHVNQDIVQVWDWDKPCAIFVVLGPNALEVFDCFLLHGHVCQICLTEEGIDDDRNEQVQKDLRNNDLEQKMESNGDARSTTLRSWPACWVSSIGNDLVEVLIFNTLIENRPGHRCLKHDCVPSLTCRTSYKSQEGCSKCLKVDKIAHFSAVLNFNKCKLRHANDCKHKDQKHEEKTERCHGWCCIQQCLEDLLQLLLLFDQAEDTADS